MGPQGARGAQREESGAWWSGKGGRVKGILGFLYMLFTLPDLT